MEKLSLMILVIAFLCLATTDLICFADTHIASCSKSDLEALIDFKNGLNDPENRLSSWTSSTNCCQWRGIICDNITGAVTTVDLFNPYPNSDLSTTRYKFLNLSGDIRPSLLKLESLTHLDLSFNTFQGIPVPEFLGSLKNLRYLNLSKAGFSGLIPPNIGNLSLLQYLDVSCEFLTLSVSNFQWVNGLIHLKQLNMDQVDLSLVGPNWSRILAKLPYLSELHMSSCGLSGPFPSLPFVNFTSLAIIDLSFNTFYSNFPVWLRNVSGLVSVDLSNCGLKGRIPLGLSELPNLRYLNLAGNSELSASSSELFRGNWRKIEVLSVGSNKLHGKLPASIGNMSFLSVFDLSSNDIEGGVPSSIGGLCNLVNFDLSGNNLTGTLPEILEGTENCASTTPLPSLLYLRLSNNRLMGKIPKWLGQIENLVEIGLSYNLLEGTIPPSLGTLQNLTQVGLGGNKLNGTLPNTFGQLSKLSNLDVSSNNLNGIVTEAHFSRLSNLKILHLSANSFILNVSSDWDPSFNVRNLDMGSCRLGPLFPNWLRSQNELKFLDISNASISGSIPLWFWDVASNLSLLNVSLNLLEGQLPDPLNISPFADIDLSSNLFEGPIPLPSVEVELLDLSNNKFSGPIPQNISESMPNLIFLSLSNNRLTGEIPITIGEMMSLQVIDLSRNNLSGNIPSSIGDCSLLKVLDLGNNNFSGQIPSSLGQLNQLQSLHLNENEILGGIPFSFMNLSSLETMDLGKNNLSGKIPPWVGNGLTSLQILNLRSNSFSGEIPPELSKLSSLQVLDLAENNFTGEIPPSFGDFKAMAQEQKQNKYRFYGDYRGMYYEESLVVNTKGQFQKYTKTLSLVISIDLSRNNLLGDFPVEITKLLGLVVLNLSMNQISGQIPQTISDLHQLSSLDLSINKLNGTIPRSMSLLTFLSYLNLSNNDLFGTIPYVGQMSTFTEDSFEGNPGLCGAPLLVKCQNEDSDQGTNVDEDNSQGFVDKWFYLSVGIGFAVGILVPFFILAIRKPWSEAYFNLVERIVGKLLAVQQRSIN